MLCVCIVHLKDSLLRCLSEQDAHWHSPLCQRGGSGDTSFTRLIPQCLVPLLLSIDKKVKFDRVVDFPQIFVVREWDAFLMPSGPLKPTFRSTFHSVKVLETLFQLFIFDQLLECFRQFVFQRDGDVLRPNLVIRGVPAPVSVINMHFSIVLRIFETYFHPSLLTVIAETEASPSFVNRLRFRFLIATGFPVAIFHICFRFRVSIWCLWADYRAIKDYSITIFADDFPWDILSRITFEHICFIKDSFILLIQFPILYINWVLLSAEHSVYFFLFVATFHKSHRLFRRWLEVLEFRNDNCILSTALSTILPWFHHLIKWIVNWRFLSVHFCIHHYFKKNK